jgi:hypothetical protein
VDFRIWKLTNVSHDRRDFFVHIGLFSTVSFRLGLPDDSMPGYPCVPRLIDVPFAVCPFAFTPYYFGIKSVKLQCHFHF